MSIFTFISRKIASAIRPRIRIFPPSLPSDLSWKRFPRPKIKRVKLFIALQKWRHLAYLPPFPSNFSWKRPWFLRPKIKRARILISLQKRQWRRLQYVTPPQPSNLSWKAAWFLRRPRIKRGRWLISRQKQQWRHQYVTPPTPSSLSWKRFKPPRLKRGKWKQLKKLLPVVTLLLFWKKPLRPKIKRGRWVITGQRWRHVIFPPAAPSSLSWKRFKAPRIKRRRSTYIRHPYIVPPPPQLVWKRPAHLRPKIKHGRWPLLAQRWRHVIFPPAQPSSLSWKKPLRPKIRRRRSTYLRHSYYFTPPTAPPSPLVWKRPASLRPKIRRGKWPIAGQHWRHVYTTPPRPAGFVARQRLLLKARRKRFFPRRLALSRYVIPAAAAPAVMTLQRVWRVYLTRPRR